MKSIGLTILIAVIFIFPAIGKTIPIDVAKKVGYHFLLQQGGASLSGRDDLRLSYTDASTASFYAFSGRHCFVIVAADDVVNPILGYATDRPFSNERIPSVVGEFLQQYTRQISYARSNNIAATPAISDKWTDLTSNAKSNASKATSSTIGPLLQTSWSQDSGYNNSCPYSASACGWCGNHVFTGCVATAMAQVMKYWNWPGHGSGTNTYTPSGFGTLSVDFSTSNYNWDAMPDNGPSDAVAKLMSDAGVSVNMVYGTGGSGAHSEGGFPSAEHAFKNFFCYQSSLHSIFRRDFSDASWISTIVNELDNYRVVMYSGQGSIGGHTWVVDGHDASNYLHCNWGWGGSSNGYYYMSNMVPAPTPNGDYNIDQSAVIGIHPEAPDIGVSQLSKVCVGYHVGVSYYPAGGAWSSSNPAVATVNSSGDITGVAEGTATIKYSVAAGCGARFTTRQITVINGVDKEIISLGATGVSGPGAVAVDASGNIYFSEKDNHVVKRITPSGTIATIAGTGTSGLSGDGGPAISAKLNSPVGIALDATGNLYIADAENNSVRKVNTVGMITTIAGTGTWGFTGDGGQATAAKFDKPKDVAVDGSGNVYIADYNNLRIRKISTAGIVTSIAGNGAGGLTGDGGPALSAAIGRPTTVAVDAAGNVYLSGSDSYSIRKINSAGTITTIAGTGGGGYSGDGGPATDADLQFASGINIDVAGNLYFADMGNNLVRMVNTSGIITSIAGTGTSGFSGDGGYPTDAKLDQPADVAIDGSGNIFIADLNNNRIRKIRDYAIDCDHVGTRNIPQVNNTIKLFPNPNTGSFTVQIPETYVNPTICVIDLSGRTIKNTRVANGSNKINFDLGTVAPGLYLIRITDGEQVYREKIMVR